MWPLRCSRRLLLGEGDGGIGGAAAAGRYVAALPSPGVRVGERARNTRGGEEYGGVGCVPCVWLLSVSLVCVSMLD